MPRAACWRPRTGSRKPFARAAADPEDRGDEVLRHGLDRRREPQPGRAARSLSRRRDPLRHVQVEPGDPRHPRDDGPQPLRRSVDAAGVPARPRSRSRARCAGRECDLVLDLEFFAKFPLVLGSLAGIPQKAGFYLTSESWRRELLDVPGLLQRVLPHQRHLPVAGLPVSRPATTTTSSFNELAAKYSYPRIDAERASSARSCAASSPASASAASDPLFVINAEHVAGPRARGAQVAQGALRAARRRAGRAHAERAGVLHRRAQRARVRAAASPSCARRRAATCSPASCRCASCSCCSPSPSSSCRTTPGRCTSRVWSTRRSSACSSPTRRRCSRRSARGCARSRRTLYSIPLFTVYNGKDVAVGKPSSEIGNAAACTVLARDRDGARPASCSRCGRRCGRRTLAAP